MQGGRKITDSSDQIAGGEERRKDNAEAQRTQTFAEKRNPRAQPFLAVSQEERIEIAFASDY